MTNEIIIILEESNSFKQGNCFEQLVKNVLETQRYVVQSDINYTGLEIDLIARHKDRDETIYVECKAKEKVSSDEITKFAFNVSHKKAHSGLFIRTKELAHQAAGLVNEMKSDPDNRYKNLTFFEPQKVIEILQESNFVIKHDFISDFQLGKEILAVTHFGDFFVFILKDGLASVPTKAIIASATSSSTKLKPNELEALKSKIPEIEGLEVELYQGTSKRSKSISSEQNRNPQDIESISEVQESENWYDYLPASSNHFVGRDEVRTSILHFFDKVRNENSNRRIFYLTGKSGWGKSSLVAELRGRARNKHYRNKFYVTAIDSRSALSSNFVGLAFKRLIRNAIREKFIIWDLFSENLSFNSSFDLLDSDSIQSFFDELKQQNKVLILIFDQFEDVFRKEGLFKVFYKLLSDTSDSGINLVIGFSWKTEILIPSENEAYHYWQQSKEQAVHFSVPEFGSKETNLLINQLENSIGKIDNSLKRRIVESSQGYPWLVKKLCIHVFEQVKSGKNKQDLLDENLNFESLFNKDLEALSDEEIKYLKYIAQRAHDGNFFEATEVNEIIPESIINSLRDDKDKRLIIRSGVNYNIYWDVFRDYLVTGKVPEIGESYMIRSSPKSCQEIFLLFAAKPSLSSLEIQASLTKSVTTQTIENCIIDLRSLGILRKSENTDSFELARQDIEVTSDGFKNFISNKLKSNTVYLRASKIKGSITNEDIIKILVEIFRGYSFQDKTWRSYANYFLNWFDFSNLDVSSRVIVVGKGKGKKVIFYKTIVEQRKKAVLRNSPDQIVQALINLDVEKVELLSASMLRDLALLDFLSFSNEEFIGNDELRNVLNNKIDPEKAVAKNSLKIRKIKSLYDYLTINVIDMKPHQVLSNFPELFDKSLKGSSKKIYAGGILSWAKFASKTLYNNK
ncbi:MAG: restriction endonuclease [Ignavibacteriae bacterium]|nr:restriction endonuclease [Bacteroidota bacterium]MCB0703483.1 restriction endonuclease [Ignavibacteriota bacterium]